MTTGSWRQYPVHVAQASAGGEMRPIRLANGFIAPSFGFARLGLADGSGAANVWFAWITDLECFRIVFSEVQATQPHGLDLATVDWEVLLDTAVAMNVKPPMSDEEWFEQPFDPATTVEQVTPGGYGAVRATRRKRNLTPDFLAGITELYETSSTEEIAAKHGVDPRTVRRWLDEARRRKHQPAKRKGH